MLKKLFALCAATILLAACESRPPLATPPFQTANSRTFTVFFETGSAVLSPAAMGTLNQAADAYKANGAAKVTATGHTDTVGTPEYNMGLSMRRAQSVKAALEKMGVPAAKIAVVGRGEEALKVKTADGVPEPQNRRVEVSMQ